MNEIFIFAQFWRYNGDEIRRYHCIWLQYVIPLSDIFRCIWKSAWILVGNCIDTINFAKNIFLRLYQADNSSYKSFLLHSFPCSKLLASNSSVLRQVPWFITCFDESACCSRQYDKRFMITRKWKIVEKNRQTSLFLDFCNEKTIWLWTDW